MEPKEIVEGRSILLHEGLPVLVNLHTRPASSAPEGTRLKAAFTVNYTDPESGEEHLLPLPVAQATMCGCEDRDPHGWTPEFRLESN